MRHLVTRIFLAFFATLLIAGAGAVALTSWVLEQREAALQQEVLGAAQAAADALAEGGRSALVQWTRQRTTDPLPAIEIFVVDEWGDELIGRSIPGAGAARQEAVEDWPTDLPTVLLDLPRESPLVVSAEGELFRLVPSPRRAGVALWRDLPLQLLALALAVTALASLLLARSITGPISKLQRTTLSLAAGNLEARVEPSTLRRRDEIGRLARSLEVMAGKLDALLRGQQQLLRDVSHEVRSPLTRIRLATGLLGQRDTTPNPLLSRIDEEVAQLDVLIDRILDVAKLESGASEWRREPLELRGMTERIVVDATFEASQLGIVLEPKLTDEALMIQGDRHWVQSAIENVVRNALRHTGSGARVQIHLDRDNSHAKLSVSDNGPGLDESELPKIFEPFYRGRSIGGGGGSGGGAGLGLAIVARVLQAHDGTVAARNLRDADGAIVGLEIALRWPLDLTLSRAGRTASERADPAPRSRE